MSRPFGLLLINKPAGITSTQVTSRVRRFFRRLTGVAPKAGHAGTLDPFATGLLPIALGPATRLLPLVADHPKSYVFTLQWGTETITGDLTGEIARTCDHRPTLSEIQTILPTFHGEILQIPPRFSALKVNGQRAYTLARAGADFTLQARAQTIHSLTLQETTTDAATFEVTCNTGTYVRTLGEDIARALGTCGHLTALTRTAIGPWTLERAIPLDSLDEITHDSAQLRASLVRPREMLDDIPACAVSDPEVRQLRHGQTLLREEVAEAEVVACMAGDTLIALARQEEGVLHPFRVFNLDD